MSTLKDARPLLEAHPIVPVVVIDDASRAEATARALLRGGIACAEVTFRTDAAAEAIAVMSRVEGMTVGAGTILNREQARAALDAGAQFLVSPGWSSDVADVAVESGVCYLPGTQTATDIMAALTYGATVVKFFPGGQAGGLPMIHALRGPFPQLLFMPSGGVKPSNLAEWITDPAIIAVSGSWMVGRDLIAAGDFDGICGASSTATSTVKELLS